VSGPREAEHPAWVGFTQPSRLPLEFLHPYRIRCWLTWLDKTVTEFFAKTFWVQKALKRLSPIWNCKIFGCDRGECQFVLNPELVERAPEIYQYQIPGENTAAKENARGILPVIKDDERRKASTPQQ
jgi:hypothetical protein